MTTETSRAATTIAYTGDLLTEGLMDVRDLGPALIAIGRMCQAANTRLNGEGVEVSAFVRSDMKAGSFTVSIELVQYLAEAKALLAQNRDILSDAKTLLELLGLLVAGPTAATMGLVKFVRWLKNRKPDKADETSPGVVHVEVAGDHIEISRAVLILSQDGGVRSALEEVVRPLARSGIDTFEIRSDSHREVAVTSKDVDSFTAPRPQDSTPENLLSESEHVAVVEVVRPHFKPGHRWGVWDGSRTVGVEMKDERFIGQVERHEVTFGRGDTLKVKQRTRAWRDDDGKLKASVAVTEVLEVIPASTQMSLLKK